MAENDGTYRRFIKYLSDNSGITTTDARLVWKAVYRYVQMEVAAGKTEILLKNFGEIRINKRPMHTQINFWSKAEQVVPETAQVRMQLSRKFKAVIKKIHATHETPPEEDADEETEYEAGSQDEEVRS